MKHSFAATNPCHVYDMALALWKKTALGFYYSGYPRWRLKPPQGFPMKTRSVRTLVTYGMQRLPEAMRINDDRMFRWQDGGFDAAVARCLETDGFIHGIPGQCLETFKRARGAGMRTVLNHASGPIKQQRAMIAPEYRRVGLDLDALAPLPKAYEERLRSERELAQIHCVASTVVRDQLVADGVPAEQIWVVPYGADPGLFRKRRAVPDGPFKICFAGRQSLRKGVHYLLKALESLDSSGWELHCFGMEFKESARDFHEFSGGARVLQRGSVPQRELAAAFHQMDVLVLPSAEEAFGLVVVQALESGVPCIVSDRVGAKDLIREGETGSIVPFGNVGVLARELLNWSSKRITVEEHFPWSACAEQLVSLSKQPLKNP